MSYKKGRFYEEETVRILREKGFEAERVTLSGQKGRGDILLKIYKLPSETLKIEQKVRKDGFKRLYKWLEGNDALILKGLGVGKRLIVLRLERFLGLV